MRNDDFTQQDIAAIRQTAVYHLVCLFLEKIQHSPTRRVKLRRTSVDVYEIVIWLGGGLGLELEDAVVAIALNDTGFDLQRTPNGRLLTNCSGAAMHRYSRELRGADAPLHQVARKWIPVFPDPRPDWRAITARIDAEIAARPRRQ